MSIFISRYKDALKHRKAIQEARDEKKRRAATTEGLLQSFNWIGFESNLEELSSFARYFPYLYEEIYDIMKKVVNRETAAGYKKPFIWFKVWNSFFKEAFYVEKIFIAEKNMQNKSLKSVKSQIRDDWDRKLNKKLQRRIDKRQSQYIYSYMNLFNTIRPKKSEKSKIIITKVIRKSIFQIVVEKIKSWFKEPTFMEKLNSLKFKHSQVEEVPKVYVHEKKRTFEEFLHENQDKRRPYDTYETYARRMYTIYKYQNMIPDALKFFYFNMKVKWYNYKLSWKLYLKNLFTFEIKKQYDLDYFMVLNAFYKKERSHANTFKLYYEFEDLEKLSDEEIAHLQLDKATNEEKIVKTILFPGAIVHRFAGMQHLLTRRFLRFQWYWENFEEYQEHIMNLALDQQLSNDFDKTIIKNKIKYINMDSINDIENQKFVRKQLLNEVYKEITSPWAPANLDKMYKRLKHQLNSMKTDKNYKERVYRDFVIQSEKKKPIKKKTTWSSFGSIFRSPVEKQFSFKDLFLNLTSRVFADEGRYNNSVTQTEVSLEDILRLKSLADQEALDKDDPKYFEKLIANLKTKKLTKTDMEIVEALFKKGSTDDFETEDVVVKKHMGDVNFYNKIKTSAYFNAYLQDKLKWKMFIDTKPNLRYIEEFINSSIFSSHGGLKKEYKQKVRAIKRNSLFKDIKSFLRAFSIELPYIEGKDIFKIKASEKYVKRKNVLKSELKANLFSKKILKPYNNPIYIYLKKYIYWIKKYNIFLISKGFESKYKSNYEKKNRPITEMLSWGQHLSNYLDYVEDNEKFRYINENLEDILQHNLNLNRLFEKRSKDYDFIHQYYKNLMDLNLHDYLYGIKSNLISDDGEIKRFAKHSAKYQIKTKIFELQKDVPGYVNVKGETNRFMNQVFVLMKKWKLLLRKSFCLHLNYLHILNESENLL